jgi:Protein of unknown function (DUF2849)
MFKAAKAGAQKAITANRLDDGRVVFLDDAGGWTADLVSARFVSDGAELDAALTHAQAQMDARVVVEAYAIDIVEADGRPVPARMRERIRAEGPTVTYGEVEYQALNGARLAAAAE